MKRKNLTQIPNILLDTPKLNLHLKNILILIIRHGYSGKVTVSNETFASKLDCSAKTIQRTLKNGKELGFLQWTFDHRYIRNITVNWTALAEYLQSNDSDSQINITNIGSPDELYGQDEGQTEGQDHGQSKGQQDGQYQGQKEGQIVHYNNIDNNIKKNIDNNIKKNIQNTEVLSDSGGDNILSIENESDSNIEFYLNEIDQSQNQNDIPPAPPLDGDDSNNSFDKMKDDAKEKHLILSQLINLATKQGKYDLVSKYRTQQMQLSLSGLT